MIQNAKYTLQVGNVLNDKWVILEFVARGGMGEVYRAHQLNLKRDVAIKIISGEWLDSLADNEEGLQSGLQRFRNEVAAMAQVRHPNVLHIFDYGSVAIKKQDASILHEYIAMEFIPGGTLRSTMSDEGFYPEENLIREWMMEYLLPVLDGVEALHAAGILHRDLKPENILLDDNTPKIADFGLAKSKNMGRLTISADMFGTPAYMSPEQFQDFRRTDQRSDIYALGKILYEALAGRITAKTLPFKSAALENAETPFLRCLNKIIRRSTSENKAERPASIEDFRESLMGAVDISLGKATRCKMSASAPDEGLPQGKASRKKWFWIAAALILSAVLIYLSGFQNRNESQESATGLVAGPKAFKEASRSENSPGSKSRPSGVSSIPIGVFDSSDGVAMHLIPEGALTLPEDWGPGLGGEVRVDSFYMDETQVTNLQYVAFLNQQLSRLTVEAGVVRAADGSIWLMLGEVFEGYEPILFKEGRFHVKNPGHAACPVVRVTAYGAAAYAHFYEERLPTTAEWLYTLESGADEKSKPSSVGQNTTENKTGATSMMSMMNSDELEMTGEPTIEPSGAKPFPYPVILYAPDKFGIRGLNAGIGEWAVQKISSADAAKPGETYSVMGGVMDNRHSKKSLPRPLQRQAWEAFEEVGFRCALNAVSLPK